MMGTIPTATNEDAGFLARERLATLLEAGRALGYRWQGPQLRDGAIVMAPLEEPSALPWGTGDRQAAGEYRTRPGDPRRAFAWANGPQALKPLVFAPRETLWRVKRDAQGRLAFAAETPLVPRTAVLGVRACDLAALELQDRHFLAPGREDPHYAERRHALLLVAVNCTHPAATCFCASTGDGPAAQTGYDLLLDELDEGYIVRVGSQAGQALFEQLTLRPVSEAQWQAAASATEQAVAAQQRVLPPGDLSGPLFGNLDHPRWEAVAERCLSCGNCTSVCPTCFCHRQDAAPSLDGASSDQQRSWDSCFSEGHSYVHGRSLRHDTRTRYRQWLTHKLGGWHAQYGRSGCVGCGRCIAWCPVGIDITEEAQAICGGGEHG
ncbi:MAG TPA: 4Fe-4S dicluster domain-containing protein [Gammaproteobacteria bacterium]